MRVVEVEVRVARADERRRWDDLMCEHHYLGFKQFAGRGLCHVAVWAGAAGLAVGGRSNHQQSPSNHPGRVDSHLDDHQNTPPFGEPLRQG